MTVRGLKAFVQYYLNLLGTDDSTQCRVSKSVIKEGHILSEEQQHSLCSPFTADDVKATIFDIDDTKSAGPDGYSRKFYKEAWGSIGDEVCNVVFNFFQTGKMLKQINAKTLCLVPKCEQPTNVTQFRPIACCNVLYKAISKMLCTRLNVVLPGLVDHVQSAFIEYRMIMHNILICQDMMKQYRSKSLPPRCTMKTDLKKAYDSVRTLAVCGRTSEATQIS